MGWAFYVVNVFVVVGYLVSAALVIRRGRHLPAATRAAAIVFFCCCTGIHAELAADVYTGSPLIDPVTHTVPWHFLALITVKIGALYTFLWTSAASPRNPPLAPPHDDDDAAIAEAVAEAVAREAIDAYLRQHRAERRRKATT